VVGVEEHVNVPTLTHRLPEAAMIERGFLSRDQPFGRYTLLDKLNDTEGRIKDLDAVGLTVQVLSYSLAGATILPPQAAAAWAKDANDEISRRVEAHPGHYAGFED
jgi:predicted TIM-barrel fold metal-dependent hydrolase